MFTLYMLCLLCIFHFREHYLIFNLSMISNAAAELVQWGNIIGVILRSAGNKIRNVFRICLQSDSLTVRRDNRNTFYGQKVKCKNLTKKIFTIKIMSPLPAAIRLILTALGNEGS